MSYPTLPVRRRAFALLPVLITLAGAGALATLLLATLRDTIGTSDNRVLLRQGAFQAEGCVAVRLSVLHDALQAGEPAATLAWRGLDSLVAERVVARAACRCVETPAGALLNVNAASEAQVRAFLLTYGIEAARADSLAAALADWRDSDDLARPMGAERAWYREQGRAGPRNGRLADVRELALVRGFGAPDVPLDVMTTVGGHLIASRASDRAIAAVEGVDSDDVTALRQSKGGALRADDLRALKHRAPAAPRAPIPGLEQGYRVGDEIGGWTIACTASIGEPPVPSTATVRIARSGPRVALISEEITP